MDASSYKNREEMVYEVLKKEILDLELKPGQLIRENENLRAFFCIQDSGTGCLAAFAGTGICKDSTL